MEQGEHPGLIVALASALALCAAPCLFAPSPAAAHPDLAVVQGAVDEMVAADPDDPVLLMKQARLRGEARDWDGALVSLAHALAHGGDPVTLAAERARIFLAAGFPRMAKLEYDTALAQQPEAYDLLFERGRTLLALGQVEAADRDFTRAIAGMAAPRPEHIMVHAQGWLSAGRRAEALRALDQGMARTGPLPSLQLTAIDLEIELQHEDRALSRLDTLVQQTPTNESWIARRADLLQRAGRVDEARAERARALQQIESRPPQRRSQATRELANRLRTELGQDRNEKEGKL